MEYPIIPMFPDLWPAVREIYAQGVATGNATFETEVPDWQKWDSTHRRDCRLVALEPFDEEAPEMLVTAGKPKVLGWAAVTPVSTPLRLQRSSGGVGLCSCHRARTWRW